MASVAPAGRAPLFSLVLCTVERTREVARLLESLCDQGDATFELIVVDQNDDQRLATVLEPFLDRLDIRRVRSPRGLSRARNAGMEQVRGSILGFPDDDCWYPAGLLPALRDRFGRSPAPDVICGLAADLDGNLVLARAPRTPVPVDRYNVWDLAISFAIFMRTEVARRIGPFDIELGVGAGTRYGSGEETDYLVRALAQGFSVEYAPSLTVHHPAAPVAIDGPALAKARRYGVGMGHVLNKHRYPHWFRAWTVARPLFGAAAALLTGRFNRMRLRLHRAAGRASGVLFR